MQFFCVFVLISVLINITQGATTYELEAKKFTENSSERCYKLYNEIAAETYSSTDDEDFEKVFAKLETVKKIASELVEISKEASEFELNKIKDDDIKKALTNLRKAGDLFVLGEDYFSSVLLSLAALQELSQDKDIDPYLNGANMPNQDDSQLAYFPDIHEIYQRSNDSNELKYYWESWRDRNVVWSRVNFYAIVESIQKAAQILEVPVLDLWFDYDHANFLQEMERVMQELMPSYKQLHAFVRKELHSKYGSSVIDDSGPIPDHLFEQVLQQAWRNGSIIEAYFPHKELPPYDAFVKEFDGKTLIDEAERFYSSLGFEPLDESFKRDQLKERDDTEDSGNCRADIFDLTPHVYMQYCPKVDFRKFMQNHGYLSRIHYAMVKKNLPAYYFYSYDLEYPVGEAVILSASTPKHLASIGLAKDFTFTENVLMNRLLRMGIHTLLHIPVFFVHTKVMNDLLGGTIQMDGINKHYWRLMEQYAGVEPPLNRPDNAIDFPYLFYIDIEQNHQTMKFVSEILGYQFYRAFCQKSGQVGQLHNCDFYGNLSVGNTLKEMMALGSSKSWSDVIAKVLPDNPTINGEPLLEYYKPIFDWLKTKNEESKVKIGWNASKKKIL